MSNLVRRTPLVPLPGVSGVSLKLESLQRTGSFKIRGAALKLASLDAAERKRGVVAASAGNHGMGVAAVAAALGIRTVVVVPKTAPEVKRRGIANLGAEVILAGSDYQAAEEAARELADETGAVFVSPFDDPLIMRGNGGTLADEILEQAPATKSILVPVGGGGLIAGMAEALAGKPVALIGVQPEANCAMMDSLNLGRALVKYEGQPTLAEGCEGSVAESTFVICRDRGVAFASVTEPAIARAVARAYRLGFIVEPSGAVPLAEVFEGGGAGPDTVVVISGGNIDAELLDRLLAG